MNRLIRYIQNYLIVCLPFAIAFIIMTSSASGILERYLTDFPTLNKMLAMWLGSWVFLLLVYLICLVASSSVRERTLTRLANIQERDEREQFITGKAARSTFISNLSIMLLMLFMYSFSIDFYKVDKTKTKDGHGYNLNVTLDYSFYAKPKTSPANSETLFSLREFYPSTATLMIILILWNLLSFHVVARREQTKALD